MLVWLLGNWENGNGMNVPHDSNGDFNGAPNGYVVEFPAGVGRDGEVHEGSETQNTDDCDKSAHAEHECDTNLLLPVHLQAPELPEGYAENPQVQRNADSRVGGSDGVDVHAVALVQSIPLVPEIGNGLALENGHNDKGQAPCDGESDRSPEYTLYIDSGEYSNVKEEQRQFQKRELPKVHQGHDVEVSQHLGDLLGLQGPDIAAQTVLDSSKNGHDCAGDCSQQGPEDQPVIEADFHFRVHDLEGEADDDKGSGSGNHGVGQDDISTSSVTDGSTAVGQADVFCC
jgi:hypothetical protein